MKVWPNGRDLTDLNYLHEAGIMYNLKERHFLGCPYTRIGDIMIAMNPFQWMGLLYSKEMQFEYARKILWPGNRSKCVRRLPILKFYRHCIWHTDPSLLKKSDEAEEFKTCYERLGIEPHVFEVSSLSYRGLSVDGADQTILVTGESGTPGKNAYFAAWGSNF